MIDVLGLDVDISYFCFFVLVKLERDMGICSGWCRNVVWLFFLEFSV